MKIPTAAARRRSTSPLAFAALVVLVSGASPTAFAQGLVRGMQDGAEVGNKAAGPVGGVLGGAIGGVVGVFGGALGVNNDRGGDKQQQPVPTANNAANANVNNTNVGGSKQAQGTPSKAAKPIKTAKVATTASIKPVEVLTQPGEPELTAEQIVANSDAYIDRIKATLNLTPQQEKNWHAFNSAMHYLGHNGAERLNLRIARAKRDPPDDIVEQMRNEAQFLVDRAADQRAVADAAEPLFTSLDNKQKALFIQEMVHLSHERGLD